LGGRVTIHAVDAAAWKRVAERVRTRREDELRLTQEQLAARSGVGTATIRLIETAGRQRYQRSTLRQVSQGLGWVPDGIDQILNGEEPTEAEPTTPASDEAYERLKAELDALRQDVEELKSRQRS